MASGRITPSSMRRPCSATKNGRGRDGCALALGLKQRGLAVVATSGPDEAERRSLDELWRDVAPVHCLRLAGRCFTPHARAPLCRAGYVGQSSGGRHRVSDRRAVRTDGPACVGPLAGRGLQQPWASSRNHSAARQCVAGAIRCRACRARSKAASATSEATANVWMNWSRGRCSRRPIRPWRRGAHEDFAAAPSALASGNTAATGERPWPARRSR